MPELIVPPGLVCGIDEAGRGPLAGTVVAAAVILDPLRPIPGLNDSKKLSEKKRDALAVLIQNELLPGRLLRPRSKKLIASTSCMPPCLPCSVQWPV